MCRDIASSSLRASEAAALGAYVTVIANRTTSLVPIRHFALTHEGVRRDHNEDSYLADAELAIFAVADGMGGHRAGAVASRIAIETIRAFYQRTRDADTMSWPFGFDPEGTIDSNRLATAIRMANRRIWKMADSDLEYAGMGTTLTLAFELQGRALIGQIGDSRAYLIRADGIRQLTRDQSLTGHKVDMGELTEEEARHDPERNILLQALGVRPTVQLAMRWITLSPSDVLLLCSDGLHSQLSSSEIHRILLEAGDLESAGLDLVDLANRRGGPDNITAVLAQFLPARASDYDDTGDEQPSTLFDWRR